MAFSYQLAVLGSQGVVVNYTVVIFLVRSIDNQSGSDIKNLPAVFEACIDMGRNLTFACFKHLNIVFNSLKFYQNYIFSVYINSPDTVLKIIDL